MLNFKVLTNLALQIPPWATWLLFSNFENKGNSLREKNCAKVNNALEHASAEFEQKHYSSNLELWTPSLPDFLNACYDV